MQKVKYKTNIMKMHMISIYKCVNVIPSIFAKILLFPCGDE